MIQHATFLIFIIIDFNNLSQTWEFDNIAPSSLTICFRSSFNPLEVIA